MLNRSSVPTLMWFSAIFFIYNHNIVVVGQIRGGGGDGEKKFRTTFAVATDRRGMIKVSGDPPTDHRAPVTTTAADDEWVLNSLCSPCSRGYYRSSSAGRNAHFNVEQYDNR